MSVENSAIGQGRHQRQDWEARTADPRFLLPPGGSPRGLQGKVDH